MNLAVDWLLELLIYWPRVDDRPINWLMSSASCLSCIEGRCVQSMRALNITAEALTQIRLLYIGELKLTTPRRHWHY